MKKEELIKKMKATRSVVEFYKLKENILLFLEPSKDIGKSEKEVKKGAE